LHSTAERDIQTARCLSRRVHALRVRSEGEARRGGLRAAEETEDGASSSDERGDEPPSGEEDTLGVRLALAALRFYKSEISPFLPPSCRYFPTCSEYAMQSFKGYGAGKGAIMTAWRLLRCSPFGSQGYDPPKWPPPGLGWLEPADIQD